MEFAIRNYLLTFIRKELVGEVPSSKKTGRRRPEQFYHLGQVSSTSVALKFRIVASEQGLAFKNIPNLRANLI
jgi:hypothetical protein